MELRRILRVVLFIAGISIAGFLYFHDRQNNGLSPVPSLHEAPIIFAPVITIVLSLFVFGEYLEKCIKCDAYGKALLQFVWSLVVVVMCSFLATTHIWYKHLAWMGAIFFAFFIWDGIMIGVKRSDCKDIEKEDRDEILSGSIYINIPSLLTVAVAIIFLWLATRSGGMNVETGNLAINERIVRIAEANITRRAMQPVEMFTTGLVAFHLLISALSYLLVRIGRDKVKACLEAIFSWIKDSASEVAAAASPSVKGASSAESK